MTLPFQLGACTYLFGDDDLQPTRIEIQSVREDDPEVPNLATVPDRPPLPSPSAQRSGIIEGLSADRQNARYTDEPLTPQSVAVPPATPPEPAYPPPPAVQAARTQVAESTPVPPSQGTANAPPPPDIGMFQDAAEPLAPPPPAVPAAPTTVPQTDSAASRVAPGPSVPAPPPAASAPAAESSSAGRTDLLYAPPTGLLQQQAFQQQALQQQQMQQLAFNQRAFEQQARLEAIQQQQLRERVIQQQAAQWKYPALRQPQIPAVAPANGPGAFAGSAAPAFAQSFAAPAPLAGPQTVYSPSAPAGLATQSVPGQLVGLIYFGHGSALLSGRDMQILQQVAALQRYQNRGLHVIGHASARTGFVDQQQHETANRTMSLRRANAVASELVRLGADQSRIRINGLGAAQPVYHEFMPTGEAGNRRVEIFLE